MIVFLSQVSDEAWPGELQKALPDYCISTDVAAVESDDVVAAIVWNPPPGMLAGFPNLRLVQVLGAGVDRLLEDPALPKAVPVARLVDPSLCDRMAEYVLLHCLALHRCVPDMQRAQREGRWQYLHPVPPARTCVGLLGLGTLGKRCAAVLSSVGFTVQGWSRSKKHLAGLATFAGAEALPSFIHDCDILVLLLPLTTETQNLVDARFLGAVKPGAALINVGRGRLVVDADLISALDAGTLRHAVLDVFRTEPLPADHPFWRHPRVTVTPHNSSATNPATALQQVVGNIRSVLAGKAPQNLVDPAKGY